VQAPYLVTGTGSSQPGGIVTGSGAGITAALTNAIASDEIISLYHAVNPAYRTDPSFGWVMNDSTLAAVRKLKDGQDNYLWKRPENFVEGAPETLLGKPIVIDLSMPSIATGQKPIVVGPLKKFKIRDVGTVRLKRMEERYGEYDQVGFIAFMRTDSKVLNAGTGPLKRLTMA
jgi:HK97 family phage major capsid protein